ncbi:ROK family protein [Candidatus Poribacteria bacterium]|nr:ROK family protein [Candidatus Poribacteria bacterium]
MKKLKNYLLGIDLGGTQLRFIIADYKTGNIIDPIKDKKSKVAYDSPLCGKKEIFESKFFTQIPDQQKISSYVILKLQEFFAYMEIEPKNIAGVGISVAGKIQKDFRFIGSNVPLKFAAKIGKYYGVDLITQLKKIFPENVKIVIENDCNSAGFAQALYYKHIGIDPNTTFYITVSTGVGGGGYKRDLDEIGHIIVDGYFPYLVSLCGCGARGCIETYASGEGIKNQALSILNFFINDKKIFEQLNTFECIRSKNKYNLKEIIDCSRLKELYIENKTITAKEIFYFANIDNSKSITDQFARYLLEITAEKLAKVIISLSNIHGIELFGCGGSVILKNPKFLDIIQENINNIYKLSEDIFKNNIKLEISPLGEYVNDYGSLLLVVDPINEKNWINTIIKS